MAKICKRCKHAGVQRRKWDTDLWYCKLGNIKINTYSKEPNKRCPLKNKED